MRASHSAISCYLLVVAPLLAHAFLVPPSTTTSTTTSTTNIHTRSSSRTISLGAKKARNKKPKKPSSSSSSSSGGFGAATASPLNTKDDYAVFPALEPEVKSTLVAAPSAPHSAELRNELYQRLEQIYGFSNFNYDETTTVENNKNDDSSGGMMSMEDLISGNLSEDDDDDNTNTVTDDVFSISQLPPFDDNNIQVLHVDPLVVSVDNFFTPEESDAYVAMPSTDQSMFQTGSMTVGKDKKSQSQRTSTTWFNHYKNVPALMAKASRLLGVEGIDRWEEPQLVRYRRNEKFTWHLDALGPEELTSTGGGQRVATLLVYHSDLDEDAGGATMFRDLKDENGERLKV